MVKKENDKKAKTYINMLMQCIADEEMFDESLIKYMLNYKSQELNEFNCKSETKYSIIKTNIWGQVKKQNIGGIEKREIKEIEKWAKVLGKDVTERATYMYRKFNFSNYANNTLKKKYNPIFKLDNGDNFFEVSEDFLKIVEGGRVKEVNVENLSDIEIKLIVNDLMNDSNINAIPIMNSKQYPQLCKKIKDLIIENYGEMEKKALGSNNKISSVFTHEIMRDAFQSIEGEELNKLLKNHELEDKYIEYIGYEHVKNDFKAKCIENHKDKKFWIKKLKRYSEKKNEFSTINAVQYFVTINKKIEQWCVGNNHTPWNWSANEYIKLTQGDNWERSFKNAFKILELFKEELKNSSNYYLEMERLLVLAITGKNKILYKGIKDFMKDDKGNYDEVNFKSYEMNTVKSENHQFLLEAEKDERAEMVEVLEKKLPKKGVALKAHKI